LSAVVGSNVYVYRAIASLPSGGRDNKPLQYSSLRSLERARLEIAE